MRENCTYGSVRGSRQAVHVTINEERNVETVYSTAVMVQAVEAYHSISASERFRELERMRARARHDEANALSGARYEGRMEGHREGRREERTEIAKNMLAEGMNANIVARLSRLTLDEVLQLVE